MKIVSRYLSSVAGDDPEVGGYPVPPFHLNQVPNNHSNRVNLRLLSLPYH